MTAVDLVFVGLAFDVVGAIVLAKGFMRKRIVEAWRESRTLLGANSFVLKSAILQKAEAWVGAGFLFVGFMMQIAGNLQGAVAANDLGWTRSWLRLSVVLGAVSAVGWCSLRVAHLYARRRFYRVFARHWTPEAKPLQLRPNEPGWLDGMGWLMDLKQGRNESDEQFLQRLDQRARELGTRYTGTEREVP